MSAKYFSMAFFIAFLLAFLSFPLAGAAASERQVELISPSFAAFVGKSSVTFLYRVDTNSTLTSCSLLINGVVIETDSTVLPGIALSFSRDLGDSDYYWSVSCQDSYGQISSQAYDFTVDTIPPRVTIHPESGDLKFSQSAAAISYTAIDAHLSNCTLLVDSGSGMKAAAIASFVSSNSEGIFHESFPDGQYLVNVECRDKSNTAYRASANKRMLIDTKPPMIMSMAPTGTVTSSEAVISVRTDERSTCRYRATDANFSSMEGMATDDHIDHKLSLSGLTDGEYSYFIRCQDELGNDMPQSSVLQFKVRSLPTAQISLSERSPLKDGMYEVKLVTSKPVKHTPHLSYAFDGASGGTKISLTGSGSLWEGYFIIADKNERKVGNFIFLGTDSEGNTGDVITEGMLFIVDTIEPPQPKDFKVVADKSGAVILEWHGDTEDISHYVIYKSTSSGVSILDYYDEGNRTSYTDADVQSKATYYYRIAAVDEAGNVGPLSKEMYVTVKGSTPASETQVDEKNKVEPPKPLPPDLVKVVEAAQNSLDTLRLDLELAKSTIKSDDPEISSIIKLLSAEEEITRSLAQVEEMDGSLESLKENYHDPEEISSAIREVEVESARIMKRTAKSIEVSDSIDYYQTIGEQELRIGMDLIFTSGEIPEDKIDDYLKYNKEKQNLLTIEAEVKTVTLTGLDGTSAWKTLVTKNIYHQQLEPLKELSLVELIPKRVSGSLDELEVITDGSQKIPQGPALRWGIYELARDGRQFMYMLNGKVPVEDVRMATSIVLFNDVAVASKVTGNSVSLLKFPDLNLQSVLLIVGLLVIAVLGGYYLVMDDRFGKGRNNSSGNKHKEKAVKESSGFCSKSHHYSNVTSLLKAAEACLGIGSHHEARVLYKKISTLYSGLENHEKAEVIVRCRDLNAELNKIKISKNA